MAPPGSLHCNLLSLLVLFTIPEVGKLHGKLRPVLYTVYAAAQVHGGALNNEFFAR